MSIIQFPTEKLNKKKIIIFSITTFIILLLLILGIIYLFNPSFRAFTDIYIFRKEIKSTNLPYIEITSDEDQFFYAYDKYITILNKNVLYTYFGTGEVSSKNSVEISSPIFASNNKFLAIAQNSGNNLYLISGSNILWQNTVDGNITKINVNKNGYVSVIVSGTSYKSIVISFDSKGKELFKTYLSNSLSIDCDISNDNKYLSIAEIDYSGSIIKSTIKNISIEKAKSDPTNSVIYTHSAKDNSLILDIKYQDKNNLIYICNDSINLINISDKSENELISLTSDINFMDINLKNNYVYTSSKSFGFSSSSSANIINTQNGSINNYEFKGSIKSLQAYGDKIAINTGSQVHFIGLNGWLIKKFDSTSEINNIILGDTLVRNII